jgi:hypothetical protein
MLPLTVMDGVTLASDSINNKQKSPACIDAGNPGDIEDALLANVPLLTKLIANQYFTPFY